MAYDFIDCIGDDVDVVSDSEVSLIFCYEQDCLLFYLGGYMRVGFCDSRTLRSC